MADEIKEDSILCVGPSWIGDMIMALPALHAMRQSFPGRDIAVLTKPHLVPLWHLSQLTEKLIELETGRAGTRASVRKLRHCKFARAYVLPNSFRSALIPFLARIPRRIGYRGHWRSVMLTDIASREKGGRTKCHQAYENIRLVEPCLEKIEFRYPSLDVSEEEYLSTQERFAFPENAVGMIPGAARGPSKCWPMKHYAELGRQLTGEGMPIAVFGSSSEGDLCGKTAAAIGSGAKSYAGKTDLREWAVLMSHCRAIVSNDSGGMHLAAALGVPLVAIFGITDPDKTGPLGERCTVLQNSDFRDRDIARDSVLARKCLESVRPETVYRAVSDLIE